jgi:hypothetical protein
LLALAGRLDVPLAYLTEAATDLRLDDGGGRHRSAETEEGQGFNLAEPDPPSFIRSQEGSTLLPTGYVAVAHARIGGDYRAPVAEGQSETSAVLSEWLIRAELNGQPADFLAVRIEDSSMAPRLENGDLVLIDRRCTCPAQPGLFAIDEGFGLAVRWVEAIPQSDPTRLRIRVENPVFAPYDAAAETIHIIGRIVWATRRL